MTNTLLFFAEKNVSSFCIVKATHIFLQQKYQCIWKYISYNCNKFVINELVKLTMPWAGPRSLVDKRADS